MVCMGTEALHARGEQLTCTDALLSPQGLVEEHAQLQPWHAQLDERLRIVHSHHKMDAHVDQQDAVQDRQHCGLGRG